LASAPLWAHLSYCLTIMNDPEHINESIYNSWGFDFIERDLEFIRWWRVNQGPIAPCLSLDVFQGPSADVTQKLTGDSIPFLLECLLSAQYLKLDVFYWVLIQVRIQTGHRVVFPNLHTVLMEHVRVENSSFYQVATLLPHDALPALRRLSIMDLAPPDNFSIPTNWSALTHISLYMVISLDLWLSFIRTVPLLQWGYFNITVNTQSSDIHHAPSLRECTLLELDTLSVAVRNRLESDSVFPLSLLFNGLHLPSVRTLALSSPGMKPWENRGALRELYTVLSSTPAVATLTLEDKSLLLGNDLAHTLPAVQDAEPIWRHATGLARLRLTPSSRFFGGSAKREEALDLFVRSIFSADNIWLDLHNDACPIRAITIRRTDSSHRISDLTMSSILENARKAQKVVLEFTSESAEQVAADVRMAWGVII
jgi:hypothetical protein